MPQPQRRSGRSTVPASMMAAKSRSKCSPHVAGTVRADLQNLGLVLRAAKRFAPGLDPASVAGELRERISEELDYEHEAQAQRAFGRRCADTRSSSSRT